MTDKQKELRDIIDGSSGIVFFGGAGVSTESGIPDFRGAGGLYGSNYPYPPERMLSHSFFMQNTNEFYRFYRGNMLYPGAAPNMAHLALAELERRGKVKAVITQNIDGLHTRAGSSNVLELHGSVYRNYCMDCHAFHSLDTVMEAVGVPLCPCGGTIKPDVVLYEEGLDRDVMEKAVLAVRNADALIVGGTSLNVYPAAGLVEHYRGDKLVLINKSETPYDGYAGLIIRESIGEVFRSAMEW